MKKLVRLTSALLAVALLSVLCAIPAAAADGGYSGTSQFNLATGSSLTSTFGDSFSIPSSTYSMTYAFSDLSSGNVGFSSWVTSDSGGGFNSAVGLYFSYYFSFKSSAKFVEYGNPSVSYFKVGGLETSTTSFTYTPVSNVYTFTPAATKSSEGVSIVGRALATEGDPLKNVGLYAVSSSGSVGRPQSYVKISSADVFTFCITNARIVGVTSSAELDALESMASAIAEQNDILQAMYGDIVAICNSIYQKTGEMVEAQKLANQYFAAMVPILNDIKSLNSSIYSLLSTQFAALIAAVETASTDIQAAIAAQTAAIIAYLDALQNVTDVPGSITDATNQGNQIQNDLNGLNKPDVTAPDTSDFFTPADAQPFTDVLGNLFSSNLIVTLLLLSLSMAFVAYVLYGKE